MSLVDDQGPELGGDDAVAAEYVLGVLAGDERQLATLRIETEQAFARLVDRWEAYFAPLAAAYASVDVPASIKQAIDLRLFASGQVAQAAARPGLLGTLVFWRGLAVAALAALAFYVAAPLINPPGEISDQRLVASLTAEGSAVRYLAVYEERTGDIGLSRIAGEPVQGHDFELWVIEGQQAPVSLGVIPGGESARMPVNEALRAKLVSGAVFAISEEPAGGSATGKPTGPVVAAGDLKSI
ncbi:MAG: anti-sigma factor [Hyphomicrobiales bacterium]|nr:anti-sigma factor [Hyphomicrobiales bacterium]